MEASALRPPAGVARSRISIGAPLLRLRSDEQLVSLFRAGNEEAFRVIYERYRQRLFAYTRQMLPVSRQDAEDALQDVFIRAYSGLRANDRDVALRAWLYRVAHNRCIDALRRPPIPVPELIELVKAPIHDPIAQAEQRESLRRLIADVRRLPEQQRSALLMRELSGMTYSELAVALGISIPAVKSLLVRARVGLAQAAEARETACATIRDELISAHDRRVRPNATARRHLHDCIACQDFRRDMRGVSRQFAALVPTLGPLGVLAKLLGGGGGAGAAAGTGAAAAGGAATTGGAVAGGLLATGAAGHLATILAAAVVTAGGAVEIQHSISAPSAKHHVRHHVRAVTPHAAAPAVSASIEAPQVVEAISRASTSAAVAAPPAPTPRKQAAPAATKRVPQPARTPDPLTLDTTTMAGSGGAATDPNGSAPPNSSTPADGSSAPGTTNGSSTSATSGSTATTAAAGTSGTSSSSPADGSAGTSSSSTTPGGASASTGGSATVGSGTTAATTSGTATGSGGSGTNVLGSGSIGTGH